MSSLSSSFANNNSTARMGSLSSNNMPLGSEMAADEAPTPPISNRGVIVSPGKLPPPLSLPDPVTIKARQSNFDEDLTRSAGISRHGNNHGIQSHNGFGRTPPHHPERDRNDRPRQQQQQRIPRFSDPTEKPITIERRLQPPTKLIVATTPTNSSTIYYDNNDTPDPNQRQNNHKKKLRLPPALPDPTLALALNTISAANFPWLLMTGSSILPSSASSSSRSDASRHTVASEPTSPEQQIESSTFLMLTTNPFVHSWLLPFLITACDVLKSGIPFKLGYQLSRDFLWILQNQQLHHVRRRLRAWRRRLPFASPPTMAAASKTQQRRLQFTNLRNEVASVPTSGSTSSETWFISGIPNYGQTCFLNAVLQALASLGPFVIYLERIVHVTQQQQQQQEDQEQEGEQEVVKSASGVRNLSHNVWKTLLAINGVDQSTNNGASASTMRHIRSRRIDPRPILKRIGETNSQFKCYATSRWGGLMEQQDAQELLQALLGGVIQDGHLDTTSSSLESTFAMCGTPQASPPRRAPSSSLESPQSSLPMMPVLSHEHRPRQLQVQPLHSRDGCIVPAPEIDNSSYDADDEKLTTVLATVTSSATITLNLDPGLLVDWSPALSPASSTVMDQNVRKSATIQNSKGIINNINVISSQRGDSVLSLSSLLRRIDAEQRSLAEQQQSQQQDREQPNLWNSQANEGTKACLLEKPNSTLPKAPHAGKTNKNSHAVVRPTACGLTTAGTSTAANTTETNTTVATSPTTTPLEPNSSPGQATHQREEKKQEDFELTIPFSASEDELDDHDDTATASTTGTNFERHKRMDDSTLSSVVTSSSTGADDDLSTPDLLDEIESLPPPQRSVDRMQLERESTSLPMSMQIMRIISSVNPSPLSGWLGSTIRCCNCKHVRPIQNAPFLDIPVIPTSIPRYLERAARFHDNYPSSDSPQKPTPASSPLPPCSLDQCLKDFTSVERVEDVECRNCTIQEQISELEDEAMLLNGAIASILKKNEDAKQLQEDLEKIDSRLSILRNLDPDDEDDEALWRSGSLDGDPLGQFLVEHDLDTDSIKKKPSLSRCEAKKCLLLTRCPSILCCHVQRRYFDLSTNRMEKCVQFVEFPLELDLAPYCAYGPRAHTPWAAGKSSGRTAANCDQEQPKQQTPPYSSDVFKYPDYGKMPYRLQSIIEHRGNAHGGHYVCYRRDRTGEWFRISDANVTPISWQQVRKCQAYMLFYEAM